MGTAILDSQRVTLGKWLEDWPGAGGSILRVWAMNGIMTARESVTLTRILIIANFLLQRFQQEYDYFWQEAHRRGENSREGFSSWAGINPNFRMHQEFPGNVPAWIRRELYGLQF